MAGFFKNIGKFFTGTKGKHKEISTLTKAQQPLQEQLLQASMQSGAGGSFGTAADYYRDLLSPDSQTAQMMFAPEQRRFNEEIIPGLSEQFAGMGSGNLNSSGFQNAAVNASTDLAERLGAIRAQLRSQAAQGLMGLGQQGLTPVKENVYYPGQEGFLGQIAPVAGAALGTYLGGPAGTQAGAQMGNNLKNAFGAYKVGSNTSPYGRKNFQLPNFNVGAR